jgi:hypothetical protein
VATPVEDAQLLVHEGDGPMGSALISQPRNFVSPGPADAYVRTQTLSALRVRTPLIDVYA